MRTEEKPSYIFAQAVSALIELEAMKAENRDRKWRGETPAYGESDFMNLLVKYPIGHNDVVSFFQG